MKQLFVKIYDLITAPLYRRLARDLTLQLQEISRSYIEQHEMLTAKMLDELLRLNLKIEHMEIGRIGRNNAMKQLDEPISQENSLTPEQVYSLMKDAQTSLDVVNVCMRNNIPLASFYEIEAKYRGLEPTYIRRVKLLEETNLELRKLITQLMNQQSLTADNVREKVAQGNGRD